MGTGRLSIIGRLPHPDWKSPTSATKAENIVVNGAQENGKTTESHDDFDIPSATATEPDNQERQETAAAAKIEGLGISSFDAMLSPSEFAQTAGSSDDLIANASETTGSPSPRYLRHQVWTNGDDLTPTGSKPASPTAPYTPSPHRRSDSIMDIPKLREKQSDASREVNSSTVAQSLRDNLVALGSTSATANSSRPSTPQNPPSDKGETPSSAPVRSNGTSTPGHRRIPTYKIALSSSLLSPARRSTSAAH
ncbi:hypothetical protein OPT61_g4356 [Boeremia exigua]|uniref:Uncharacterized protein n=1 Tax=Boeremia exigua TaxID=749465 RepID=A0ACC2IEE9_9PLEO|nr:hypothetical protein OPT61_g4356 [Boeremia exigua]